jgi:predicted Zn-dependent protease
MANAQLALPLMKKIDNRVGLAKLRWCVGDILREQGKVTEAIATYREARAEAEDVGMRGDVAAIHLVLADVLLQTGQEAQAEWEIRAALPIIDEERMVPEGIAALSLLRESLRHRRIDKQALRELHGYFQEK